MSFTPSNWTRELIGEAHYMASAYRLYDFPVNVYREDENGNRILLRTEAKQSS